MPRSHSRSRRRRQHACLAPPAAARARLLHSHSQQGTVQATPAAKASWKAGTPTGLHQGSVVGGLHRLCQSTLAPPEAVREQRFQLCGRPLLPEEHIQASERLLLRSICHLSCSCPSTNGAPGQRQRHGPAGFTLRMPALCVRQH